MNAKSVGKRNLNLGLKRKKDLGKSFPWIKRNGENLKISALQLLQFSAVASRKFLNFVTILGPARQGKSFLMNCIIGCSVFDAADAIDVCTKGVQVAGIMKEVENGGGAFFVDTEGQGDEDIDSDTTLLTPIILLSKVILFNWKGGLQKNQILNELAILVEVGNSVSSMNFKEDTVKFGHLHIVLRDFHYDGTKDEAFAIIFDEENKRGEKVKERNQLRKKLLSSFESINVCFFPAPSEDLRELHIDSTSPEFKEALNELNGVIMDEVSEPRRFGTVVVNAENAEFLLKKFVKEMKDGDIVHVKSVITQLQRGVVDEAKRDFEESLIKAFKDIHVPVKSGIEKTLSQKRDSLLDEFRKNTDKVDLEQMYKDDVLEDLENFADREIDLKRKENQLAIQSREAKEREILIKAGDDFRSAMENELRKGYKTSQEMSQYFKTMTDTLISDYTKITSKLDWIPEIVNKDLQKLKEMVSIRIDEKIKAKQQEEFAEMKVLSAEMHKLEVERQAIHAIRSYMDTQALPPETYPMSPSTPSFNVETPLPQHTSPFTTSPRTSSFNVETPLPQHTSLFTTRPRTPPFNVETPLPQHTSPFTTSPRTPPSNVGLKFYKGGQFTPGGGRSPSSGTSSISSNSSGGRFYKGGQFTPGGGRAPKGGCWK
ncbi:uncharacterized protein LOC124444914 isoform X2 [Xenia sp. Carnegie-2017]|uniref:uncharacterized protein LOC124444914 isoform X2 n=1 Tax=Xenia sp. Carnegie-2017 TaxID=2897299 RepID=UPI001F037E10|nr:uncharacterized protein LOC124444914 isoform X2 [Xenia sp. Carnegie-2017]